MDLIREDIAMKSKNSRCIRPAGLFISLLILILAASGAGAETSLTPLPPVVAQGEDLVISASQDGTFDPKLEGNEVVFRLPEEPAKAVKPKWVNDKGRIISVVVPRKALSGEVAVKKGGQEIGRVALAIGPPVFDVWGYIYNAIICVGVPLLLFLVIFLMPIILAKVLGIPPPWNLAQALSEKNSQPSTTSASRLIAFFGLFLTLTWAVALLMPAAYWYPRDGIVP
jgi:hypothetical protein